MQNLKFFIISFVILCLPWVSLAGKYKANATTVNFKGLVPCGKSRAAKGESELVTMPCQFCHFFIMLDAILDFIIKLAFITAVGMLVFAGVLFFVGGGLAPDWVEKAKSIIWSVSLGLLIIFGAWIIVNTIFVFLGIADWAREFTGPGKWFTINCPIELP